jgi:hypothetical protein
MLTKNGGGVFALGIILTVVCASVYAQQTVYKWVDEDGVVHFTDAPPNESEAVESETLTTAKPPPYVPPAQTTIKSPSASETDVENQSAQREIQIPPLVKEIDITEMSLADLDRRCEDVREEMIAPLREAEIAKCKQTETTDPARCERFWADYGDGGRTASGGFRPRMFHDLPECVEAWEERNRRGL